MKTELKTAILLIVLIASVNLLNAQWTQYGSTINGVAGDQSGTSTSLSYDGKTVVIGSPSHDGSVNSDIGQVKVYTYNGTNWIAKGSAIDGQGDGDYCGNDVDIDSLGNTIVIASFNADGSNGSMSGQVRIFAWSGSAWLQKGVTLEGEAANDEFGTSVSISSDGSVVAIGARGNTSGAGHVRVFAFSGTAWIPVGNDIDGDAASDRSGNSVSISSDGTVVAIGAPENDSIGNNAGQLKVYKFNGNSWTQRGADLYGNAAFNYFGKAVSLNASGTILSVKYEVSPSLGYLEVYEYNGSSWVQKGTAITGERGGDNMDKTISISASGNRVAFGAPLNDAVSFNCGMLRLYEYNGTAWVQLGTDIYGSYSSQFGYAICLSGDGHKVASGAYFANSWAGYVNVYRDAVTTNINTTQSDLKIDVYPNPTTGTITIEGQEIEKIEIFDITGKRILEMLVNKTNETISVDISAFNNGVYLLKVQTNLGVSVNKIVLK